MPDAPPGTEAAVTPASAAAPIAPPATPSSRDALLAELEKIPDSGAAPIEPPAPPAEEPAPAEEAPAEDPAPEDPADSPKDEEEDDLADEDTSPKPIKETAPDAATARRLETIQRAEKRSREALARERQDFEAQRRQLESELAPLREAAERYRAAAARAKYDPAGVLEALGVDDLDYAARQAYQRSKGAAADPKLREAADRAMREREHADALADTRRELAELRQSIQQREQAATAERRAQQYIDSVAKVADDAAPLVQHLLAKNPERTRVRLTQVALHLAEQTDEAPEPADVVREMERMEREELELRGIDYAAHVKSVKRPPVAPPKAPPPKTLPGGMPAPRPAKAPPKDPEEARADLVRELEHLNG